MSTVYEVPIYEKSEAFRSGFAIGAYASCNDDGTRFNASPFLHNATGGPTADTERVDFLRGYLRGVEARRLRSGDVQRLVTAA